MLIDARLAYMNHGDKKWTLHSKSFVHRNLDCEIDPDKKKQGYFYNCSIIPLFELGSLHHDYYLLNMRLPAVYDHDGNEINVKAVNTEIGKLVDIWMVGIHQNGGFTQVSTALKTLFLPIVLIELFWFRNRLKQLPRSPTLLEKTLLFLGATLSILNLPLEVCNYIIYPLLKLTCLYHSEYPRPNSAVPRISNFFLPCFSMRH